VSKKINLIKQFDDHLAVEMPEDVSVSELIFNLTLEQNSKVDEIRRVTEEQLETVATRALTASASDNLTVDVRYFNVVRELSHFLSLATEGPRPNGEDRNTDLLPEYHPSSTAELSLDPAMFRIRRGEWYSADPRIEDEEARPLVAAVYGSHPMDVKFQHAYTRLLALPAGAVPRDIIVSPMTASLWGKVKGWAANVFKGKNSRYWRSLRASQQLRDSKGRWIEMGGGGKVNVRFPRGNVRSVTGKVAGYSTEAGFIDFEVKGIPGLKDGLYKIPAAAFEGVAAILPAEAVKDLPIQNAVPDNDLILDIKDLKPTEYPEGWAPSPYTVTNPAFDAEEVNADAQYMSGDGYNVVYIKNPKARSSNPKRTQAFIDKAKERYGDKLQIIGDDGTENLDMSKPLYFLWGSKRSKGATPIGIAQDWAGVQKIAGNEDDRFGDKDNQSLTPEEQPRSVKPKAEVGPSPKEETPSEESDETETSKYDDGSNPDGTMPAGWTKIDNNTYLSKNRRYKVTYGYGQADTEIVYDPISGEVSFYPVMADNVYTLTERDGNADFTKDVPVPFFNWLQVQEQINAIEKLEALDPLFNSNIDRVPPQDREKYSEFDPSERFEYDYFGPDSKVITRASAIVAEFLERAFPGSFKDEKFNENGFWTSRLKTGTSAKIFDAQDGLQTVQISEEGVGIIKSIPVYPGEDPNTILNEALREYLVLPDELANFNLMNSFKDFDITNGRNAKKILDGIQSTIYEMYMAKEAGSDNRIEDDLYDLGKLAKGLKSFISDKEARDTDLGPSPKEEDGRANPRNADDIPNERQIGRLVAILNSRFMADNPEIVTKVREIKKNPENHTVREVNELAYQIEKNFRELSKSEKELATWIQKDALNWALDNKKWPEGLEEEYRKKIQDNTLTRDEASTAFDISRAAPFKPRVAPPLTEKEIADMEEARAAAQTVNGKPDYWLADQPTEKPKYLSTKLGPGEFPPSDGQLVGIERFLEDRDIPEDVKQEFLDTYQQMNSREIREWYYNFKEYPFKEQYRPKNKYGLVAKAFDGASDRMLASIERIFDKGLASDQEIANIVKLIPNLNIYEVSTQIIGELKAREDAHDSIILQKATADGTSINDLDLLSLIGRSNAPDGWENYKPTEEARTEIAADQADQEEVKKFAGREARKNAARRSRYALSRLMAHIAKRRDEVNADGKRILDGALEDVQDLKRLLDLRNKYVITPAKVMERLQTIMKGLNDSDDAHTYGRIRKPNPKTMDVLNTLSGMVDEVIGRDGYHNGPYEYDPVAEDEPAESTSATSFEPNSGMSSEIPSANDPVPGLIDYSNHPNRPRPPRRVKPKAFWGVVRNWLSGAKTWDDVDEALEGKTLHYVDIETTGVFTPLQPDIKNDPIQIAINKVVDGQIVDTFVSYVNPGSPLSAWAMANLKDDKGNPITQEWIASLPSKSEVIAKVLEFLGPDAVLAGHNVAAFDLEVINRTLREAGLDEYVPAGIIDTLGLADYIYNPFSKTNPSGPYKMGDFGPSGSTSLEALGRYEGISYEGLHNSVNDLDLNIKLLSQMIKRAKSNTDLIKDNVFDLDLSDNDYDAKLAKYEPAYEAYIQRALKFIADKAIEAAARGSETSVQDLENQANNARNSTSSEGTPASDRPTFSSLFPPTDDGEQPITVSNVVADPVNRIKPPSPKQLKSVERRLLDPRGLVSAERAAEIWDLLPNVNSNEIGDLVREMDSLELDYAIANDLEVDSLRVPIGYDLDKLNAYLDRKFPNRRNNTGPSPKEETPLIESEGNPRGNISRLIYSMVELEDALKTAETPSEKRNIASAIERVAGAIDQISTRPSPKEERPADRKNKADLAANKMDISFIGKDFTDEQRDAIEAGLRGWSVVIKALAGTGKTTTLIGLAKAILNYYPQKRILAMAFNKAIKSELETKFPGNTEVRTMDSLAFQAGANSKLSKKFSAMRKQSDNNNRPISGLADLADYFKVPDEVELVNGERISKFLAVKIALKGLNNWTISGDEEISRKHFEELIPAKVGGNEAYTPSLLALAKKIWADKLSPHDASVRQVSVNFNDMMKNFALTHPNLKETNSKGESIHGLGAIPDILLIDEAQDTNGVFYKMLEEQSTLHNNGIQLVVVGDPHQSIYGFRGAVNSLGMFQRDVTVPLTMMFRAGQEAADYANQVLEIKDEDDERLVGNPNKKTEVVVPGSMVDPDAILTMSNAGALDEIMTLLGRGLSTGVTREFKVEMNSFLATAKWLLFGANPKYRPGNMHEDLSGYDSWKQMIDLHTEDKDPSVSKLLSILEKTEERLQAAKQPSESKDVFKELERVVYNSRIIGIPGFVRPEDGNWGTAGNLGNFISYQIKNGNIRLYNTGDAKPWTPELKNPNNGTKNNSDTLKSMGYVWDTGKTWDWNLPVEGDGSAQLEALYNALTGKDVDTVVLTIHRSKGLEFPKVRLGSDMAVPNAKKDAESIKKGMMPRPLATENLNLVYVGLTRAMDELDPGSADWLDDKVEEFREKRKDYQAQLELQSDKKDSAGPSAKQEPLSGFRVVEVDPNTLQKGDIVVTPKGNKRIKMISRHDSDEVSVFFEALDGGGGASYVNGQMAKKVIEGPSPKEESPASALNPNSKYDYTTGWDTSYLGGPNNDVYKHSWKSPDGKYEANIINAKISVRKNGKTIFEGDNAPDAVADQETVKESSLDLVAQAIESDSDVALVMPKAKDGESQTTYESSTLSRKIKSLKDSIASTDDLISYMEGRGRNLAETDPEVMRDYEKNKAKLKGLEFVESYRKQTGKNRVTAPNSVLDGTNEMFTGSTSMQTAMSQEEIDAAYDAAIQAEYDYQMSLEPISRDPQFPGGERGLKELTAAVNAAERVSAQLETPVLDPIPAGLDPEEYVAQLRSALPDKKVELFTDENGDKFVKISEAVNKSGILGASQAIFGWKDLEDTGPSPKEESPKKPIKSNKDAVDQVMAQVSEAMDKGIIPWKKPWTGGGAYLPTSGATGKNYKGGNLIILEVLSQFRGYKGTRWYTKNAIAKLGGYVDDNDGVLITKVVKSKYTVKPDETKVVVDPKTGDQKPDDGSRTRTRLDVDVVYNEDVVKGITIPPLPRKEPPAIHEIEDIILESYAGGPNIVYTPGDSAFWSPQTDTISLPLREQFNSTEEHLDTLFHELTHSTGAADRLDRKDLLENYGTHKDVRAREELIAEIGSAILAAMFGVNTSIENVTAYVQSWKRFLESEPNALFEAASMASKAVDYILAGYYEDNPDEEYDPEKQTEAESMPIEEITGEDSTFGGLGNGINYRIEGNRIFLMGSTMAAKDLIKSLSITPKGKSIPFSFFWDRKASNWSISLADPEDRVNILSQLRDALGG
jgi:antirestriction protein ArdC/DNA polymerase III epsilon subunit-like protein